MSGLDAVINDFDGTLTPQHQHWYDACEEAFAEIGLPVPHEGAQGARRGNWYLERTAAELLPGAAEKEREAVVATVRAAVRPRYHRLLANAGWRPGAREAVDESARLSGGAVALWTSSWPEDLEAHLRSMPELPELFPVRITSRDTAPDHKPHPLGGRLALGRLADLRRRTMRPERVALVGDQETDVDAAIAAGFAPVLLEGPLTAPGARGKARAVIDDIRQLGDALRALLKEMD